MASKDDNEFETPPTRASRYNARSTRSSTKSSSISRGLDDDDDEITESDQELFEDAKEDVDIDYYIKLGHKLRAQQVSESFRKNQLSAIIGFLKSRLSKLLGSHFQRVSALRVYSHNRSD